MGLFSRKVKPKIQEVEAVTIEKEEEIVSEEDLNREEPSEEPMAEEEEDSEIQAKEV